jgi:hypothetical protein
MDGDGQSPIETTTALAAFADAMLPGDDIFPSASAVGAHGILALRLRDLMGPDAPGALAAAFVARGGLSAPADAAALLEKETPALFDAALMVLYYAYYETPAAIAAIRSLGIVYNDAPQPLGYAMRPFDPALDLPGNPRGHFVPTAEVVRVDLSGIDFLSRRAG